MAERERVENKVNIKIKHLFDHQEQAINETIKSIKSYLDLDELNYYNHKHFAIEMETGTGKTFTFINTIFQLYNNFADKENPNDLRFKKFIILVPLIAIREGIANTFYDFKHYFKTQYNNLQYEVDVYQDGKVSEISNFLDSNDLRILILTKQSFDSKNKILHQNNDDCFGRGTYINQMQATHPVVIIDEPQLNKGFNTNEMIDLLKPSFVLSYSATPPEVIEKDIIYKYTPEQAYNDRQVKRLEYYSITIGNSINATIELKKIQDKKADILYNGVKECTLKVGDNFGEKVGDNGLRDYFVGNITNDEVFFTNQTKLSDLIAKSVNQEDLLRAEINETIKQHKNKNEKLKERNIKQLSLFFVPRVADFITSKEGEIGIVQTIFKEEYKKVYGVEIKNEQFAYYFSEKDNINKEQEKEMTRMILKRKTNLSHLITQLNLYLPTHHSVLVGTILTFLIYVF